MASQSVEHLVAKLTTQLRDVAQLADETRALASRQLLPGSTALVLAQLPREVCLAEAAGRVAEAYNLLHGGLFNRVVRRGGEVQVQTDDRNFRFALQTEEEVLAVMEETLLFTHALLVLVAPEQARGGLVGVSLRRRRGPPSVPFGSLTSVRRGAAHYALRYSARDADIVVPRPSREDLTYEAVVRTQISILKEISGRAPSMRDQTLAAIRNGANDQGMAAKAMGLSSATLRRRLAAEGEGFRSLRQQVLRERADALLGTALALPEIAERLGFSDVRSFNRAYAALTGTTPAKARRGRTTPPPA